MKISDPQEERKEEARKRQEQTKIKTLQKEEQEEKEKARKEREKQKRKEEQAVEFMKMLTPKDRVKAQRLYQKLRAELEGLTWLSPEPENKIDRKIFDEEWSFHTPANYPTL
jgi:uncharacterized protein (DUF342 family)